MSIPLRKISKTFLSKLAKNCIPNIIKSINFHSFWSIWWCLVCTFLSILKQKLCLFSSRVWRIKNVFLVSKLNPFKIRYLVVDTLKQKLCLFSSRVWRIKQKRNIFGGWSWGSESIIFFCQQNTRGCSSESFFFGKK